MARRSDLRQKRLISLFVWLSPFIGFSFLFSPVWGTPSSLEEKEGRLLKLAASQRPEIKGEIEAVLSRSPLGDTGSGDVHNGQLLFTGENREQSPSVPELRKDWEGFPPPPPEPEIREVPSPPEIPEEERMELSGGYFLYDETRDLILVRGQVRLKYKDITGTAEELLYYEQEERALLRGEVVLRRGRDQVQAESLEVNFKTRTWRIRGPRAMVWPQQLLSPLYLSGSEVEEQRDKITSGPSSLTTCDLPAPHFRIGGRKIIVIPGKRLMVEKASLYLGSRRLLTWPRLVLPLRRVEGEVARHSFVPQFGQDSVQGVYLKTAYNYILGRDNLGTLRLDFMSRQGIGGGVDQSYSFWGGTGLLTLYGLLNRTTGEKNFTGRWEHFQPLPLGFQAHLQTDWRRSSFQFVPGTTTVSSEITLQRLQEKARTQFNYRVDNNRGFFGEFVRRSTTFSHFQRWGQTEGQFSVGLFGSDSPGFSNRELNTSAEITQQFSFGEAILSYQRRDALRTPPGGLLFASLDRLPELTLRARPQPGERGFLRWLPGTLVLGYGRYREQPSNIENDRFLIDFSLPPLRQRTGSLDLGLQAGLRQTVYDSQSAQYILSLNSEASWRLASHTAISLRYLYLRPRGFTPFRFDLTGRYNTVVGDFTHRTEHFRFSLFTGYNLQGGPFAWQDLLIRSAYRPSENLLVALSTAYDLNRSRQRDIISDFRWRKGNFWLDLGTRYNPTTGRFSTIRWHWITPLTRTWSIESMGGYNGFRREFDYRILRLIKDHHDWRWSISFVEQRGFRVERGIRLSFHLKAFPVFEEISTGQFGQRLDTAVGDIF